MWRRRFRPAVSASARGSIWLRATSLRITVRGTGGHGALPHTLTDPVVAAGRDRHVVAADRQPQCRRDGSDRALDRRLIADGATNIIPPTVEMEGTLRTMDETWRGRAKRRVAEIAAGTAAAYGVEAEVKISDGYPCVVNDPALTARARQVVGRLWGADRVEELALRMTAEDFGSYTKRYPSCFFSSRRCADGRSDGRTAHVGIQSRRAGARLRRGDDGRAGARTGTLTVACRYSRDCSVA